PQSAIETGAVEAVLSIPELVKYLVERTVPAVSPVRGPDPEDAIRHPDHGCDGLGACLTGDLDVTN
ncbi:MAG: hypothetical protein WD178_04915, partial [Actinomycetota bacterium]